MSDGTRTEPVQPPFVFAVDPLRAALSRLPLDGSADSEEPSPSTFYVPPEHARALEWETPVVVGARGSGKTFWWKALQTPALSGLLTPQTQTKVLAGFGVTKSEAYPSRAVMVELLSRFESRDIWWAIVFEVLRADSVSQVDLSVTGGTWHERVRWIAEHREQLVSDLNSVDLALEIYGERRVLLFDALDRAAYDWPDLTRLLRGLLEVVLDLGGHSNLRAKVFIRPDQFADEQVWAFRDAAKLKARRVDLEWSRAQLYQMFFHRLANDPTDGEAFREGANRLGFHWSESGGLFRGSDRPAAGERPLRLTTKRLEELQAATTASLAGPFMGKNDKRGQTFSWLPLHLADGHRRTSPRSFLVAWRVAGERSAELGNDRPVHYNALKAGVQRAAAIRVDEIKDDSPWVGTLCGALEGSMPMSEDLVVEQWRRRTDLAHTLAGSEGVKPRRFSLGPQGWLEDLLALGVLTRRNAGRIDMPDVYRVGFKLRKKGGIKPVGPSV